MIGPVLSLKSVVNKDALDVTIVLEASKPVMPNSTIQTEILCQLHHFVPVAL